MLERSLPVFDRAGLSRHIAVVPMEVEAAKKFPRPNGLDWLDWRFPIEDSARRFFEMSVWPNGVHCPHCGSAEVWRFRDKGHDGTLRVPLLRLTV